MTKEQIKTVLDRVLTWPRMWQEEMAEIEVKLRCQADRTTPDELRALDEAERSGTATDYEVEAAFRSFRL
jgi:hypothetical protein